MKIIQIDGGIGRVLSATPALAKLAQTEKIVVVSHWIDCFIQSPDVHRMYHPAFAYLFDDVISGNEFLSPEPYHLKSYYDGGKHLAHAFAECLGVEIDDVTPRLFLDEQEIANAKKMISEVKQAHTDKPVIMLQAFGATNTADGEKDPSGRGMSKSMVNRLLNEIDAMFINFSQVKIEHAKVINVQEQSLRPFMALTSQADYCLGIDSCMMHVAAATGRVGAFFFGVTDPRQLGYDRFMNIQRHGYPRRHQPMRFAHDVRVNAGAMDWTDEELGDAINAIKDHLARCLNNDVRTVDAELSEPTRPGEFTT